MRATLLALGSLALLACGEDSTSPPLATPSDVLIVSGASGLGANAYDPNNLTFSLASKQSVKWRNDDGTTHTVTADGGDVNSGNVNGGETFTFTFTTAGAYPYDCTRIRCFCCSLFSKEIRASKSNTHCSRRISFILDHSVWFLSLQLYLVITSTCCFYLRHLLPSLMATRAL